MFEFVGGFEVIGYESLPLHNGEVNLNLIEATCVDRGVHEEHVGPLRAKTIDRLLAAVGRAVVHDPENATCWVIRLLAHDFRNQAIDRSKTTPFGRPQIHCHLYTVDSGNYVLSARSNGCTEASHEYRIIASLKNHPPSSRS
jgi:hypothetical protein